MADHTKDTNKDQFFYADFIISAQSFPRGPHKKANIFVMTKLPPAHHFFAPKPECDGCG